MFLEFAHLCIFPCDVYCSCALFACINKENVSCWDTDWPLKSMLAFFSLNWFQISNTLLSTTNWFMDSAVAGKARTQRDGPKLYIFAFSFLNSLEDRWKSDGKSHVSGLPDCVCSIVCPRVKISPQRSAHGVHGSGLSVPLQTSFALILGLLSTGIQSTCISSN